MDGKTFYYIVVDMDVSLRNPEILSKSKLSERFSFGSIRKTTSDFIPVLFDIDDVDRVAKRYRDLIITKLGTINSSVLEHSYPVFGTVALGFQLIGDIKSSTVDMSNKDYSKLDIKDMDVVEYNKTVDGNIRHRGVVYSQAFNKLKLVSAKYYANINILEPVGFAILNSHPKINKDDILFLKNLYDNKEKLIDLNNSTGGTIDYKKLYMKEKLKYLKLKEKLNK